MARSNEINGSTPDRCRGLVVVNGQIASGKNAVSTALAGLLEGAGSRVAVIDLDEIWFMVDHQVPRTHELERWLLARRAAAALTDEFFAAGIETVIINGPFFTDPERSGYLTHLRTPVQPFYVTLRVSFEEAFRRAQGDPRRTLSKQHGWLKERHAASDVLIPRLLTTDLVIDTGRGTAETAAMEVYAELARRDSRNAGSAT